MKYRNIKNKIALKEVLENNGYTVGVRENNIDIANNKNKLAYIGTDDKKNDIVISVLDKNITIKEAKELLAEIETVIDIYEYIKEKIET